MFQEGSVGMFKRNWNVKALEIFIPANLNDLVIHRIQKRSIILTLFNWDICPFQIH